MGTRSLICYKENEKYTAVYCHYDGYANEAILLKHYQDYDKYKAMVNIGYLSSLETTVEACKKVATDKDVCTIHDSLKSLMKQSREQLAEYVNIREGDELTTYKTCALHTYDSLKRPKIEDLESSIKHFNNQA